jgi:RNA polymerase sigma-70 factor (ECF subfamily)
VIRAHRAGDAGGVIRSEALVLPAIRPARAAPAADPARLHALVKEHLTHVWRSLLRLGVPRWDADDAVQQVFIVASRKVGAIRPGSERAFLLGIAFRIASRARRTQQRRREVLDPEPVDRPDPEPGADDLLDRARALAVRYAILDAMPIELRVVFVLYELDELTMAEIAEIVDLPIGTVASRLRRAREQFQAATRRLAARGGPA